MFENKASLKGIEMTSHFLLNQVAIGLVA